jgi:hypothetical protein
MPDPLKSAGQDMQQEAANKLIDIQAHHLLARVVPVSPPKIPRLIRLKNANLSRFYLQLPRYCPNMAYLFN